MIQENVVETSCNFELLKKLMIASKKTKNITILEGQSKHVFEKDTIDSIDLPIAPFLITIRGSAGQLSFDENQIFRLYVTDNEDVEFVNKNTTDTIFLFKRKPDLYNSPGALVTQTEIDLTDVTNWNDLKNESIPKELDKLYTEMGKLIMGNESKLNSVELVNIQIQKIIRLDVFARDASTDFLNPNKRLENKIKYKEDLEDEIQIKKPRTMKYSIQNGATFKPPEVDEKKQEEEEKKKEAEILSEVNLHKLNDPLSVFIRKVCGFLNWDMSKVYISLPVIHKMYLTDAMIEEYYKSLKTTMSSALSKLADTVYDYARGKFYLWDIVNHNGITLNKIRTNLLTPLQEYCAYIISDASFVDPARPSKTKMGDLTQSDKIYIVLSRIKYIIERVIKPNEVRLIFKRNYIYTT
jgi:hypothetical protein